MAEKKESYGKRVGKNVGSFLNRVNRGVNEDTEARRKEREQLNALIVDAGMTYATRGTNKLAAGAAPKKAKGGKVAYDYIPQGDIKELKAIVRGEHKTYKTKDILDGAYVKATGTKVAAMNTASADKVLELILAYGRFHEEDKKEFDRVAKYIKLSDIKYFQKYLTNDLIVAFYCGVRASFDFKGDYEMSVLSGIFGVGDDWIEGFIDSGKKACKDKAFELGLKYPDYDFEKLLGKPKQTKIIKGKKNPNFYQYTYKIWIWDSCVAGKVVGAQRFKNGKKEGEYSDYTYGEGNANVKLKMGYLGFVSSDSKMLDVILLYMANDENGYVKAAEAIYNGLGGVPPEALKAAKIKFDKGGEMKDDKWIQSTVKEMEKKGTVGLFTKKAKRRDMTPKQFMKEVLTHPEDYDLKTRREAQWMANVTGDKYEWGGKVDTGVGVSDTLNKAYEYAKGGTMKKQGYDDKLDESLSMRKGKASTKKQTDKDRRDESKGMEKAMGRRAYASVGTMDKGRRKMDEGGKLGIAWQNRNDIDYFSVDVDTEEEQYRDLEFKDYDSALAKYKQITSKDEYKGEELENVQLLVVFEDGEYHTELYKDYYAKGGSVGGRYIISLDGRKDLWRGNDYDEAYDEFLNQRSKYLYKMDVILIDTLNDETLDYYDAQEDREQDDYFAKGGKLDSVRDTKSHFGISTAEWNKMTATEKTRLRKLSREDLEVGRKARKQGYNDKLDESLGNRKGKESTKKQSLKDRRDESKGEEKALGKRAYSSVSTMDKLLPFLSWHKK